MERWANAIAPGPTGVDVATTAANLDAMDVGQMLNHGTSVSRSGVTRKPVLCGIWL